MANKIKYNSGIDVNAFNVGDWSVGADLGMGPSASTGFKNGLEIPPGGYAIYTQGINARIALDDTELIFMLNKLGANVPDNDKYSALAWAKANNVLVLNKSYENIVTDNLIFNLDARHVSSFASNIPTVNLAHDTPTQGGWSGAYTVVDSSQKAFEFRLTNFHENNGGWRSWMWDMSAYIGQTVTISAYFEGVRPGDGSNTIMNWLMIGQTRSDGHTYLGYSREDQKYQKTTTTPERISWTGVIEGVSPWVGFTLWGDAQGIPGSSLKMDISNVQIELQSEVTPFVNGTRTQNPNWYDLAGGNKTATKGGNPIFNEKGYWEFRNTDGDGDYEYFKANFNNGVLKAANTTDQWTIETMFRDMGSARGSENIIVGRLGHHSGILQRTSGGGVYGQIRTDSGGTGQAWIDGGETTDGIWNHAVLTYNNRVTKLYINGVLKGTHTMSASYTIYGHNDDFYIGGMPNNAYRSYTDIMYVRAYSKELSHAEVNKNYFAGDLVTTNPVTFVLDPSNKKSLSDNPTVIKDLVNNTDWIIEGTGSKIEDNNGVLRLNAVDSNGIYAPTTGWYGKMATSWWMRYNGAVSETGFYSESHRTASGCYRINSYIGTGGVFVFRVWDNSSHSAGISGTRYAVGQTNVCDGEWHHVTVQWSNGSGNIDKGMYVFVDGILDAHDADAIGNDGGYQHMQLGGTVGCVGTNAHNVDFGPIVQYKNYNLSYNEVYQNYSAHAARFK